MVEVESFLQQTLDSTFRWYQQADTKAQIILGFTGVFLSLIFGAMLSGAIREPSLLLSEKLSGISLVLLFVVLTLHFGAVICSATALWSRGVFNFKETGIVFFGQIANYRSYNQFKAMFATEVSREEYIDQLTKSIHMLSRNTRFKHQFVDIAVVFSGCALIVTVFFVGVLMRL